MNITSKKIINNKNIEIGSILSAEVNHPTNEIEKEEIEKKLVDYAFSNLYPREGLHIYSDVNIDTPSIVVLKDINSMEEQKITIS